MFKILNGGADKVYITKNNKICLKQKKSYIDKNGNDCTVIDSYYLPNNRKNRNQAEKTYGKLVDYRK